jgi:hypothetical protein
MNPNQSFIFSSLCSSQFYKPSSYHPPLTTWTSKLDRTPRGPRYLRRVDTQQTSGLAKLRQEMPNNSSARRDKNEKKKKRRETTPLVKQMPNGKRESLSVSFFCRFRIPRGGSPIHMGISSGRGGNGQLSLLFFQVVFLG